MISMVFLLAAEAKFYEVTEAFGDGESSSCLLSSESLAVSDDFKS